MAKEDVVRYLEWAVADGREVVNDVCGVRCVACDETVLLEPGSCTPVSDRSRVEVIESMDDIEPHEVRIYCSEDCRRGDLLRTDGGVDPRDNHTECDRL